MKSKLLCILLLFPAVFASGQNWTGISSPVPVEAQLKLLASDIETTDIRISLGGYYSKSVMTPAGMADIISLENATPLLEAGCPDLPKLTIPIIIPDNGVMSLSITNSQYVEFQNVDIAPSKGNFTRDIHPDDVPYTYGQVYSQDAFYPADIAKLQDPYIVRDFRGQTIHVSPFSYNPVTRVLRVYTLIDVRAEKVNSGGSNLISRTAMPPVLDAEFGKIYERHFINYEDNFKYTPLSETGKMLVICYGSFMSDMQAFVNWKNTIGIPCEMVNVSTAGATSTAIKTYVQNYYNTNGLTHLLLVGDAAQIPTFTASGGGSDNTYGYLSGNDHYQEIFVGRFSAENTGHVQTQVARTISYERNPTTVSGKFSRCTGIASSEGPGDDGEDDWQHIRYILNDLTGFTYTSRGEFFDGSQGGADASGNPSASMISTEVNNGTGIMCYTGHGSDNSWVTSGFSNTNISSLTNTTMWPFILSVACVNGNFTSGTCFAEAWVRKTHNNLPAGAVATHMSTINQSWNPPMEAQDEMVDILTESYSANIKRSFGGITVNGMFKMNDTYNDVAMTDTWTIFGDPSLMVRTADPQSMTVSHPNVAMIGESSMAVNCNVNGALVCLTKNYQIIGTAYVSGGVANVSFSPLANNDSITVAVTAFNYIPYIGKVPVLSSTMPNDASAMQLIQPQSAYNCSGVSVQPAVIIRNMGVNALTSATVYMNFNGSISSQSWTGNLSTFATDTVFFAPLTLMQGTHNLSVYTSLPNGVSDTYPSNDTISRTITVQDLAIVTGFTASETEFCNAPATVSFTNTSQNAVSYLWDFGDGNSSTDASPVHQYAAVGVYSVTLTADAGVCGSQSHTEQSYIVVGAQPPVAGDAMHCGAASLTLTASGSGNIAWYDAATGGNLVGSGSTFITPVLSTTTTYYA